MMYVDAVVIGGGVLGCFAARNLRRWNISVLLIEEAQDVCTGITRANSAIVYAGYDNRTGSLKARMTVAGNGSFSRLCDELEVPFERKGSLMAAFGPNGDRVLREKKDQGAANGVAALQILSGREAREREPMLAEGVTSALFAPTTGTVNPWRLGIAAYENALQNGCRAMLNTRVQAIRKREDRYLLETDGDVISCKAVLNCAGLQADRVQELLFPPTVRLLPDAADFLVFDKFAPSPKHILFQEGEAGGKGITAVPTVEGNLLLEGPQRPMSGKAWATSREGLDGLRKIASEFLPGIDFSQVIRSFAAVRPNPHRVVWRNGEWVPDGKSINSFTIENPGPGFYSLIGIKTPGLTCAQELGMHLAGKAAAYLQAGANAGFDPKRTGAFSRDHDMVCLCEGITRGEVLEAIRRGAVTVDGVKRRAGTGMGRCQGSRCSIRIQQLLEESGHGIL